jgi:hypothetical protein
MVVAQAVFVSVMGTIISWLLLVTAVAMVVKIFQALFDGFAGGDGGGFSWPFSEGNGSTGGTAPSEARQHKNNSDAIDEEYDEASGDGNGEPGSPDGTPDYDNPGYYQIKVINKDGTPQPGVQVKIRESGRRRPMTSWGRRREQFYEREGPTNRDGRFPSQPEQVGSGFFWVYVDDESWYQVARKMTKKVRDLIKNGTLQSTNYTGASDQPFYIPPGNSADDPYLIEIAVVNKDEAVSGIEPRVVDIRTQDGDLELEGEIQ